MINEAQQNELTTKDNVMYPKVANKGTADISKISKNFAKLLLDNDSLYEEILRLIPCNVFWKNTQGEFLGCNQIVADIFGFDDPKQIIGKTNYELFDKEMADKATEGDEIVLREKRAIMLEEVGLDAEGSVVTYMTTKSPLVNTEGEVVGLLGIAQDITAHKRLEQITREHEQEAIRIQNEHEKQLLEEKLAVQASNNKYIGTLAHEMRTPLASLRVVIDMIKINEENNPDNKEERAKNLKELDYKSSRIERSMCDLIDMVLFKVKSANNGLDKENFSLSLIREDVEEVLEQYPFNKEENELIKITPGNSFVYNGLKVATRHVLSNLIKNTLKIIREEDKGSITISFDQSDKQYNKLIFEDDAKGIDPNFLPRMFDSFVYKDHTGKGTGLGLSFCKTVMKDYGGDIICESELGKYTRFICSFPKVDMSKYDFA